MIDQTADEAYPKKRLWLLKDFIMKKVIKYRPGYKPKTISEFVDDYFKYCAEEDKKRLLEERRIEKPD